MSKVNGVLLVKRELPQDKTSLKATNPMKAKGFTLHNTYNDASAENEISYMQRNDSSTSFHYAIDDKGVVQGLPLDRNGWHAGDGRNGYGNRNTYGVEICYSKSGGEKYDKAEDNAIKFVAQKLFENGWDVTKVWKHKDWSGKNCPHRILARSRGWEGIIEAINNELVDIIARNHKEPKPSAQTSDISKKGVETLAQEVIAGKWGQGAERKKRLGDRYDAVQKRVNEILNSKKVKADPLKTKGVETLAREVIEGKWGHGDERKIRLGVRYPAVQARVNEILNTTKRPKVKSIEQLARETIAGVHGNGEQRKKSLGNRYDAVQKRVNQILRSK